MGFSIDIQRGNVGPAAPLTPPPGATVVGGVVSNQDAGTGLAQHLAAADPHPQYATDQDLLDHEAAPDPHPQYATDAEVASAVSTGIDTHEAAANPHPQYLQLADLLAVLADVHNFYLHAGGPQIVPGDIIDGGAHNQVFSYDPIDGGTL